MMTGKGFELLSKEKFHRNTNLSRNESAFETGEKIAEREVSKKEGEDQTRARLEIRWYSLSHFTEIVPGQDTANLFRTQ